MNNSVIVLDNVFEDTSSIDRLYQIINNEGGFIPTNNLVSASDLESNDNYSEIDNISRTIAKTIWYEKAEQLLRKRETEFKAFEIWTGKIPPDTEFNNNNFAGGIGGLNYHLDKDEILSTKGELSSPIYGSAFYIGPRENITGGEILINTNGKNHMEDYEKAGGGIVSTHGAEWIKIPFRYNRLVLFDGLYPHFVAPVISRPVNKCRVTIAVNAWNKDILGVPPTTEKEEVEIVTMFH
jgi:hypothetical protein